MTDITVSPCRGCTKQGDVKCRSVCKKLKEYRKATVYTILPCNYAEQYERMRDV